MTEQPRAHDALDAKCRTLLVYMALVGLVMLTMRPVLSGGTFHMLDSAGIYAGCATASVFRPGSLLCLMEITNQARPGQFMMYLPAFVATSARLHYWFQSGLVLFLTLAGILFLVQRVTGRRALAFAAAAACMFTAPFAENFFTLFKCEIFMQFGAVCIMCALWLALCEPEEFRGRTALLRILAVIGAIYALTVKETAGMFLGVMMTGLLFLLLARPGGIRAGIRLVAWPVAAAVLAFGVLVVRFLSLPSYYTQGGTASYSLAPEQLAAGIGTIWTYLGATASYVLPAAIAAVMGIVLLVRRFRPLSAPQRAAIAWTLFAWAWFACNVAAYVPWSGFQVRYMLVANTSALLAVALSVHLLFMAVHGAGRMLRAAAFALAGAVGLLVLAHSIFSFVVGNLSEARIRCAVDAVDDAMVSYIAAETPAGGTAYIFMDKDLPEPMLEMQLRLGVFYRRPDIHCIFPRLPEDMDEPGLVCVPDAGVSYNPNRVPIHQKGRACYQKQFAGAIPITPVTNVARTLAVWYADARAFRGVQHCARMGLPAFWRLKRGGYGFAWNISRYDGNARQNLVRNGTFTGGLADWSLWWTAGAQTSIVATSSSFLRIVDRDGRLSGVKQSLEEPAVVGGVYRLSASARTVGRPAHGLNTGLRVVFHMPQGEHALTWPVQSDAWINRQLVFTNTVVGTPVILAHMGYGQVTGITEVARIRLECIGQTDGAGR